MTANPNVITRMGYVHPVILRGSIQKIIPQVNAAIADISRIVRGLDMVFFPLRAQFAGSLYAATMRNTVVMMKNRYWGMGGQ